MKLMTLLLIVGSLQVSALYSQNTKINLQIHQGTIEDLFNEIERQSGFSIFYKSDEIDLNIPVEISASDIMVKDALEKVLETPKLGYKVINNIIIISSQISNSIQQQKITGTVTDATNSEPIIGANIIIEGTTIGTVSDADGKFTIEIPGQDVVLIISFMGFNTERVTYTGHAKVEIKLVPDITKLEEVVVVGYGTQKRKDMTGAISNIKAENLKELPLVQFTQKLQGKVAGLQIIQSNGRPGEGVSFRIRGSGSLSSSNVPLIVVDGFPIVGEISNINPDEIESFSVLKDASATALYGSRAANGVILVTTKRGKQGKTKVEFSTNLGIQVIPERGRPELMNGREYAQFKKNYYEDMIKYTGKSGYTDPSTGFPAVPPEYQNPEKYGEGTDWFGKITRNAPVQNYNISISGGNEKVKTSVIAGYSDQKGCC